MIALAHSRCLAFARQFSVLPGIAVCNCLLLGQVDLDGDHGLVTFRPHPLITMLGRACGRVCVQALVRVRACMCVCVCVYAHVRVWVSGCACMYM